MSDTASRLLALLSLLQTRRFWPGEELSERLEVTPRTVRRDVDRLRELGYAVAATSGPGGGYRFGTGKTMPPVLLTEDEAVALAVALRTEVATGDAAVLPVLAKLEQLLPERLRARVAAVHGQTVMVGLPDAPVEPRLLSQLAIACRDSEAVRLRYRDREAKATLRTVHPLRLAHTASRRWYLVCWDPAREGWRTLRLDRIEEVVYVGPRVVRPEPPADVATYVTNALTTAPYPCRATFRFAAPLAALQPRVPGWMGVAEADGPDHCLLHVGGSEWGAVAAYALILPAPIVTVVPEEARVAVEAAGRQLLAAAADSRPGVDAP